MTKRIGVDPDLRMAITVGADHLSTDFHEPISSDQLGKRFHYFNLVASPNFQLCYGRRQVDLVNVNMVDTLMILVIEQYSTDVRVGLFHSRFEGFYFHRILDIYDMLVSVLEG